MYDPGREQCGERSRAKGASRGGRYDAVYKKTGSRISAQFVHLWKLRDGKVRKFQQYTDTLQVAKAIGA